MEIINIGIVEDNVSIAGSLSEYIELQPEFNLSFVVSSIESLQHISIATIKPDIILMDIILPGISGINGIGVVLHHWPDVKVIMNSVLEDSEAVYDSLRAGALGYITKDMSLQSMKNAVLIVHSGGSFMNARIARKVVDYFHLANPLKELLTEKEWQVSLGIKEGKSYKIIAAENDMTIDGVRFYIQKIYRKLNINSRGQLAAMILKS